MSDKKRPPREWEGVVDKQIRDAIERGEFDGLSGRGRPIDLGENPFVPRDWRLAYKLMQDAGVSPEWIEQDKEIRRELSSLGDWIESNARSVREQAARAKKLAPDQMIAEYKRLTEERDRISNRYRARATELNRQIDLFNLKAPVSRLQHPRVRVEDEIDQFLRKSR